MRVICRGAEAGFPCRARSEGPEVPRRPWGRPSLPLPTTRKQRGAPLSGPTMRGRNNATHLPQQGPPLTRAFVPRLRVLFWRRYAPSGAATNHEGAYGVAMERGGGERLALPHWPALALPRGSHPAHSPFPFDPSLHCADATTPHPPRRARSAIGGRAARAHWPRPRREAHERRRRWRTAGVWARAFVRAIAPSWSGTTSSKPYPCWGGGEEPARGFRSRLSSLSRPRFPPSLLPTLSWGDSDGRRAAPPEGRGVPM